MPYRTEAPARSSLQRLFEPRAIAIAGISRRAGSFGERTWANLQDFSGTLFPVNPHYAEYAGHRCYPDVASLPEIPDCVLVATARDAAQDIVRQCADLGVGGVVLYASGYAETALPERIAAQQRLAEVCQAAGMALLGPNCMGYVHTGLRIGMTFGTVPPWQAASDHAIALVSQSGAIGTALMQSAQHGVAFSHLLTSGNSATVDVADQIAYLADTPDCRAVACVLESIGSPQRFFAAVRMARQAGKPVVVFKVARSAAGMVAAASHTGALAGSDAAYTAAFRRAGVVVVEQIEHLLETTVFLAKSARLPTAIPGVAVLSASGGMAILAVDKAQDHGVALPPPGDGTLQVLQAHVPEFGAAGNPCDMTAQVANDVASLAACADALLLDERYGALVFPHTAATRVGLQRLQILEEAAARRGKMVCVVWLSGWLEGPGATEAEQFGHCAVFRSVDSCMRALSARGHPAVDTHTDGSTVTTPAHAKRKEAARRLMASIAAHDLTETEGLQLLSLYGIAVPDGRIGQDADAAAHAACAMGFPVVMKVVSRDIAHKSDVGGVRLDVRDEQQARDAYTDILQSTAQARPAARVEGVLVQSMAGRGLELFAGTRRDPVFGVLVVVGFGGVLVEVLRDIAVGIAPVDHRQACAMVRSLRGARLLEGLRGQPSVDVDALAACVVRLSDLATDLAHAVAEIDVNPLICSGGSILAVDALVRR